MSLTDRLAAPPRVPMHGAPCSVGELLDTLPSEEAEALTAMLGDTAGWSASRLYEALVAEGHRCGRQTIGTHRRRQCRCYSAERAA